MWAYIVRRILYNIPVFLAIVALVFTVLRLGSDPVKAFLGKNPTAEQEQLFREKAGLDRPPVEQYFTFLGEFFTLDFSQESWAQPGKPVEELLRERVGPSLAVTVPSLLITTLLATCVGMISAFYRGRFPDKTLMLAAVLGMCISYLVYIILGQHYGAAVLNEWLREDLGTDFKLFAIEGYEPGLQNWFYYCLLPVLINVVVALGYDARYYRAVMVEECNRDYITTAVAKGATRRKVMFVHMLKNAMIPIITRVMITLPFLLAGALLVEKFFGIPGVGRELLNAIVGKDFPVIQVFTTFFAAIFIASNILTDVLYALVDPRVRLQ
ncbi:MAG: ABC transporter permease [Planctomycetota bacterium]